MPTAELTILDARPGLVVIDKPSGLPSVPGLTPDSQDNAWIRVCELFPEHAPMVCHRLDVTTSGLMVFALDADTHRHLSMQFESRRIVKRYTAVVEGRPHAPEGRIDLPLRPDFRHKPWQMVDRLRGLDCASAWRVLAEESGGRWGTNPLQATRLELEPITGRTHQLRVHCAHPFEDGGLGCPILGDELYGDPTTAPRLLLHAARLEFTDPDTGDRLSYLSPAPF